MRAVANSADAASSRNAAASSAPIARINAINAGWSTAIARQYSTADDGRLWADEAVGAGSTAWPHVRVASESAVSCAQPAFRARRACASRRGSLGISIVGPSMRSASAILKVSQVRSPAFVVVSRSSFNFCSAACVCAASEVASIGGHPRPNQYNCKIPGLLVNLASWDNYGYTSVSLVACASLLPFEPAIIQIGLLLRRGGAAEHAVAMREATEAADDVGMPLGVFQILVAGFAIERDAAPLVVHVLRMHEGQEEEAA